MRSSSCGLRGSMWCDDAFLARCAGRLLVYLLSRHSLCRTQLGSQCICHDLLLLQSLDGVAQSTVTKATIQKVSHSDQHSQQEHDTCSANTAETPEHQIKTGVFANLITRLESDGVSHAHTHKRWGCGGAGIAVDTWPALCNGRCIRVLEIGVTMRARAILPTMD